LIRYRCFVINDLQHSKNIIYRNKFVCEQAKLTFKERHSINVGFHVGTFSMLLCNSSYSSCGGMSTFAYKNALSVGA
jgi:hypothetical protein